jgi:hypothetical protein
VNRVIRRPSLPNLNSSIQGLIRDVPDYPKPGIVFKDITPLLANPILFRRATEAMASPFKSARITHVVAVESRGFILGGPIAQQLEAGLCRCVNRESCGQGASAELRAGIWDRRARDPRGRVRAKAGSRAGGR